MTADTPDLERPGRRSRTRRPLRRSRDDGWVGIRRGRCRPGRRCGPARRPHRTDDEASALLPSRPSRNRDGTTFHRRPARLPRVDRSTARRRLGRLRHRRRQLARGRLTARPIGRRFGWRCSVGSTCYARPRGDSVADNAQHRLDLFSGGQTRSIPTSPLPSHHGGSPTSRSGWSHEKRSMQEQVTAPSAACVPSPATTRTDERWAPPSRLLRPATRATGTRSPHCRGTRPPAHRRRRPGRPGQRRCSERQRDRLPAADGRGPTST